MNFKNLTDLDIILLTQAIITIETLRVAMDCKAIKEEFYKRFPNVDLCVYEAISNKTKSITLEDFITVTKYIKKNERDLKCKQ